MATVVTDYWRTIEREIAQHLLGEPIKTDQPLQSLYNDDLMQKKRKRRRKIICKLIADRCQYDAVFKCILHVGEKSYESILRELRNTAQTFDVLHEIGGSTADTPTMCISDNSAAAHGGAIESYRVTMYFLEIIASMTLHLDVVHRDRNYYVSLTVQRFSKRDTAHENEFYFVAMMLMLSAAELYEVQDRIYTQIHGVLGKRDKKKSDVAMYEFMSDILKIQYDQPAVLTWSRLVYA